MSIALDPRVSRRGSMHLGCLAGWFLNTELLRLRDPRDTLSRARQSAWHLCRVAALTKPRGATHWPRYSSDALAGAGNRRGNPPLLAALSRHVFRPAQVDRRLEISWQERPHPFVTADPAAGALVELGFRFVQ